MEAIDLMPESGLMQIVFLIIVGGLIVYIFKSALKGFIKFLTIGAIIYVVGLLSACRYTELTFTEVINMHKEPFSWVARGWEELINIGKGVNPSESGEGIRGTIENIIQGIIDFFLGFIKGGG